MNNRTKLLAIMGELFGVDPSSLSDASSPDTLEAWDSMGGIELSAQLEREFKVKFGLLELDELRTVGIIIESLREKGVDLD
ncbi:MAG: acyl carrier protein [Planctomycetes bacterium]|nr:acyl carrier protein [Planctomycetota bacterium]